AAALIADTSHSCACAHTAVHRCPACMLAQQPPTNRYTYGYVRSEDLAGIFIVVTIAASSALAAWKAVPRIAHPRDVQQLGWVAAAGVIGFAGNELVAHYRIRVGRKIGSAALVADGLHARTAGLNSLPALA